MAVTSQSQTSADDAQVRRRDKAASITVAICTRNRPDQLRRAVGSILAQVPHPADVLVVDNAPSDDRAEMLLRREFPLVRYVREDVPGLDFARNRALRSSSSDIVAFLDDDAVAEPGWLTAILGVFRDFPTAGVCTGRILPLEVGTDAQRMFEANGGLFASSLVLRTLPAEEPRRWSRLVPNVAWAIGMGSGCNLAVRRPLALELGGFDEALDLGEALPGGGDNEMVWRMLEAGARVVYQPAAAVRHEHRREDDAVVRQILGHQKAAIAVVTKAVCHSHGLRRLPVVAFLAWRLVKPGVRLIRRAAGRDPLPAPLLLKIWLECVRGLGAYSAASAAAVERKIRTSDARSVAPGAQHYFVTHSGT